mgnify:CR=1 FL=1
MFSNFFFLSNHKSIIVNTINVPPILFVVPEIASRKHIEKINQEEALSLSDKIAVINEGELVELGTHEELMNIENGQYKTLYDMQFKKQEEILLRLMKNILTSWL